MYVQRRIKPTSICAVKNYAENKQSIKTSQCTIDRCLKTVPEDLFYTVLRRQYYEVICSHLVSSHTQRLQHHDSTVQLQVFLRSVYLMKHIFQNNKRRWCIKTETGKHQQYISDGFTLSLPKRIKKPSEMNYSEQLAEHTVTLAERAWHVSQLHCGTKKPHHFIFAITSSKRFAVK